MTMTNETKRAGLPRWLPLAVIAVGAGLGAWAFGDRLSFQALADNREALLAFRDANYLGAALAYAGLYVLVVSFSIPGALFVTLAGGFLFGLVPGTILTVLAATVGATNIFLAARWGLGDALAQRIDGSDGAVRRIRDGLREDETSYLLIMRLVPAVPFFVANLLPGLLGVPLGKYVATTFVGIIPGTAVYTWVGAGLGEVFARGTAPDLGIIFEPQILGPLLALGALALVPVLVKRLRGRTEG
jgi:uncharacterized membrane protein YdjX (TVP38/TMEM64 family)